jgi:CBS domain-containing protein
MKLSEMFHSEVVTAAPQERVRMVLEKMKAKNVGAVVVVEKGKVEGIVTDRDIAMKATGIDGALDGPVSNIMTKEVVTIWDDQGVFNASQYMRGRKMRRLPIIDRKEQLVGILTADDLFAMLAREFLNVAESLEPALGAKV